MARIKNCFYLLFLLCLCFQNVKAQNRKIDSLLTVLKTCREDTSKVKILIELGGRLRIVGEFKKALQYSNDALSLSENLGYKNGVRSVYNTIGLIYRDQENYPEALKYYFAAVKIYEETGGDGIASVYVNIGSVFASQNNFPEALKYYSAALKIFERVGAKSGIAKTSYNIGTVYHSQGNYPEALKSYFRALKVEEETGNLLGKAWTLGNIGIIYQEQKNYTEALKNYNASLKISEQIGDKRGMVSAYGAIGAIYQHQENYTEALKYLFLGLKISYEVGRPIGIAGSHLTIGGTFAEQGKYTEALEHILAALKSIGEKGEQETVGRIYFTLGDVISKQTDAEKPADADKKHAEALSYLAKAMTLAKEKGNKENLREVYQKMSNAYKRMDDYKRSLEYFNLYIGLKDSMLNNETTRRLEQQRTQYEVEKAIAEGKLQQEKLLADEKFKQEKILADERVANEKKLTEEKNRHELLAAQDKFRFELALADERTEQEKIKAEEQLKKEHALAKEKYRSGLVLAANRAEQEKEKAAIKRRNELLMMGAVMLVFALVFVYLYLRQRNLKQRAIERADSIHKMAELELQSLRAQLNPHFMFNSLNAIQDLILKEDNRNSHRYLSRFSKLLRMLLDNANQPFVSLRKEIDFLQLYLSLENLRIPDLQHEIKIEPGIDTETTMIPNMMMQPYIENAIWHGLSHKTADKKLEVNIHRKNGSIHCDIEDNGVGRKKAEELKSLYRKEHRSKGMELLSKRFSLLSKEYGTEIKTDITDLVKNGQAMGTLVEITVPLTFSKKAIEILHDTNNYN